GGDRWEHHGDRKFSAASTAKIPVMIETFRQIDAGKRSLDDRYTFTESDQARGSGILSHLRPGLELTFYDLLYLMISISDNAATNILIREAGLDNIKETMLSLGMKISNLDRLMSFPTEEPKPPENMSTPNEYAGSILAVLDDEAASEESCRAMEELLTKQQNHNRLARYLPRSESVRFGSKTGTIPGVANDVGFIQGANGRIVIAVYTENYADTHVAEEVIGRIARAALIDTGVAGPTFTS
ncbi:MAG TPA: serine hydrolase, partial [Thermomicrobiaceae bacterium]|nr:serine hydrolase [Thermomicrobiaceae bacterium]